MDYKSVAQAREMSGLRLVLGAATPGPWSISARALLDIRKVPFIPVRQELGGANEELVAWTGRRNAPVAVYEQEPALDDWLEIAMLAERLGSGPSLFPEDPVQRALAAGFSSEICGHGGFGWSRRQTMMAANPPPTDASSPMAVIARQYSIHPDVLPIATARVIGILHGLSAQLHAQAKAGSDYLVGDRLSTCDVHWACFSLLIQRLPLEACPLPPHMHDLFNTMSPEMRAAVDPILIAHRDRIWERHIGLPLDY
jgi:glutathione S-transferase